jgi:hypothetical protein
MMGLALLWATSVGAQSSSEWHDDLVEHLAGKWKMDGQVMGRQAHHRVEAGWVLHHQFLSLHEVTSGDAPASEQRYEATWFLGYDAVSDRYVLHLLDIFGARFSETLGYGILEGNRLRFTFEYPDGPFHTTFLWDAQQETWEWLMEQKGKDGKWSQFADLHLTKLEP